MNRRTALPVLLAAVAFATASAGTAVAGHAAFTDAAGTHEAGIHFLADSGVTGGCGGGKFCTEDAVKRGQMATFLHRFSGKGSIPPVVNADKVDGLDAEQLRGQRGPAGPTGATGAQGPAGPAGQNAASATTQAVLKDYECTDDGVDYTIFSGSDHSVTLRCKLQRTQTSGGEQVTKDVSLSVHNTQPAIGPIDVGIANTASRGRLLTQQGPTLIEGANISGLQTLFGDWTSVSAENHLELQYRVTPFNSATTVRLYSTLTSTPNTVIPR